MNDFHCSGGSEQYKIINDDQSYEEWEREVKQHGKMIRVLRQTLNPNCYVVDHLYNGIKLEIVRSKEQIVSQNINLLLDYYEIELGLCSKPMVMARQS